MPEQIVLRPYQLESVEALRQGIRDGHRAQLLVAPTGAGKTVMAAHLLGEAQRRGSRASFVVDRVSLVDQTSMTLDRYGIDHGVVQAGHWRRRGSTPIQVCSAQTLEKRGFLPDTQLLIVDEAHCTRQQTTEFIRSGAAKVLGLTATPFTEGLSRLYTNVVNVTTTNKLIDEGYLVPLKVYAAKAIDMSGAKVVGGEWAEREIEERGTQIVGDIVNEWVDKTQKHFGGPAKTIVFSATVAHGDELCRQFQAAGFNFVQVSYKDGNDERRRQVIEEFRRPHSAIHGLVSCEALTKGFDVPDVLVGIAARPYRKSFSSHIQQLGRVMRTAPGKEFALWLDHCGNYLRFYDDQQSVFRDGVRGLEDGELDKKARKEPEEHEVKQLKCAGCGFVLPGGALTCPACGHARPMRQSLLDAVPGTMVEVDGAGMKPNGKPVPPWLSNRAAILAQLTTIGLERKKGDVRAAESWVRANYRDLYLELPAREWRLNPDLAIEPSAALRTVVRQNFLKWIKKREAERAAA